MKSKNKLIFFIAIIILFVSSYLYSDSMIQSPGVAGAPILKIGLPARTAALSDTFSSIADDVSAIYFNPAGLCQLESSQVQLNHDVWFMDSTIDSFAFGTSYEKNMYGFGIEYRQAQVDDYVRTLENANNQLSIVQGDNINFRTSVLSLSYSGNTLIGEEKNRSIRIGFTLKSISQQVYTHSNSATALDFGLLYGPDSSKNYYSLVLQNIGENIGTDVLPTTLRLGTGYKDDIYSISGEFSQGIDSPLKSSAGLEFYFSKKLFIFRLGGSYQKDFNYTTGFGLNFQRFMVDYAFVPNTILGDTHRMSITMKL